LKQNNFDWDKAVRIFKGLTDLQMIWLGEMIRREAAPKEAEYKLQRTAAKVFGAKIRRRRRI